jgi:hypothetical protein
MPHGKSNTSLQQILTNCSPNNMTTMNIGKHYKMPPCQCQGHAQGHLKQLP